MRRRRSLTTGAASSRFSIFVVGEAFQEENTEPQREERNDNGCSRAEATVVVPFPPLSFGVLFFAVGSAATAGMTAAPILRDDEGPGRRALFQRDPPTYLARLPLC